MISRKLSKELMTTLPKISQTSATLPLPSDSPPFSNVRLDITITPLRLCWPTNSGPASSQGLLEIFTAQTDPILKQLDVTPNFNHHMLVIIIYRQVCAYMWVCICICDMCIYLCMYMCIYMHVYLYHWKNILMPILFAFIVCWLLLHLSWCHKIYPMYMVQVPQPTCMYAHARTLS